MLKRKPTRIELRGEKEDWEELEHMKQLRSKSSKSNNINVNNPFPTNAKTKSTVESRIGYTDQQREVLLRK
jgi:hypothetical protein